MECIKRPGVECETPIGCTYKCFFYSDDDIPRIPSDIHPNRIPPENIEENLLPEFNMQIIELAEASTEMDNYDLDSFNPENAVMYRGLRQQYVEDALKLIDLITANPDLMRQQLKALLKDH